MPETEEDRDDRASRFRALYTTHYQAMLAYAIRRTEPSEDATDIVADIFTTAWRRLDQVPLPRPTGCGCTGWRSGWWPGGADPRAGCVA